MINIVGQVTFGEVTSSQLAISSNFAQQKKSFGEIKTKEREEEKEMLLLRNCRRLIGKVVLIL